MQITFNNTTQEKTWRKPRENAHRPPACDCATYTSSAPSAQKGARSHIINSPFHDVICPLCLRNINHSAKNYTPKEGLKYLHVCYNWQHVYGLGSACNPLPRSFISLVLSGAARGLVKGVRVVQEGPSRQSGPLSIVRKMFNWGR